MTMTQPKTDADWETIAGQWRERAVTLQEQVNELRELVGDGVDVAVKASRFAARISARADRQRAALDILNRRVLSQRFRLRQIAALGRDLTKEEYVAAAAAHPVADRLDPWTAI